MILPREDDLTSPEVRAMVDQTVQLLKRRAGVTEIGRRLRPNDVVERRLELIRRQAEARRGEA